MNPKLLCFEFIHHTFEVFFQFFCLVIELFITFVDLKRTACQTIFQPWSGNLQPDGCVYLLVVVKFGRSPLFLHGLGRQNCFHLTLDHPLQSHDHNGVFFPQHPVGQDDIYGGSMPFYSFHIHDHTVECIFVFKSFFHVYVGES